MENFGKFMVFLIVLIVQPIISGFVFMKLWLWLIVPALGLDPLTLIQSIVILFMVNYFKMKKEKKEEDVDFWKKFLEAIVWFISANAVILFFGWILSLFI